MTTISPIRYEVEIQEPLSTPVPMPPSMSSSEALVIWMFRIAMKAPIMAARMAIHTFGLARSALAGAAGAAAFGIRLEAETVRALMASPLDRCDLPGFAVVQLGRDVRNDRHARPQVDRRAALEHDLHGDALHDLGEVAGGVVGRQQREFLSAGRGERVNVTMHDLAGEHVDGDVDRLAFMHMGQLRLLVIRDHIGAG